MSDATEPPRCVWSSASPTSAASMRSRESRAASSADRPYGVGFAAATAAVAHRSRRPRSIVGAVCYGVDAADSSRIGSIQVGSTMCGTGVWSRSTSAPAASSTAAASTANCAGITGSSEPWAIATGTPSSRSGVERPALDARQEAGHRDDRGRPWPVGAEAHRPAHHGALREPAEHDAVDRHGQGVEERASRGADVEERLRVGRRDAAERVPVAPPGGR